MVDRRDWAADTPGAERIARATGVAFVIAALVAFFIAGQPDAGAAGDEVISHFRENEDAYKWQALLFGLAAAFFVWFFGTLASALRRAENDPAGRIPAIVVVASATTAALYLAGVAAWTALAKTAQEDGADRALFDLGDQAFALANFSAAALALAVGFGLMRTRLVADWLGWVSALLALLILINGLVQIVSDGEGAVLLGMISFVAFLAWTATLSAMLWARMGTATRDTTRETRAT